MDLQIADQHFLVGGATSGLGKSVAEALLAEGARVTGVARSEEELHKMADQHGAAFMPHAADLSEESAVAALIKQLAAQPLHGVLINAGGPPAMSALDTKLTDWDHAYQLVLRWKVQLVNGLLPQLLTQEYGRLVFVESRSVKQPLENLVLSNSLRLAVVGWVKTLANEIADRGVTLNIMAPGIHDTPRITSLAKANSAKSGQSVAEAKADFQASIPVGFMGHLADFGSLGSWLLSPHSRYLTGQTISVDGGVISHVFG